MMNCSALAGMQTQSQDKQEEIHKSISDCVSTKTFATISIDLQNSFCNRLLFFGAIRRFCVIVFVISASVEYEAFLFELSHSFLKFFYLQSDKNFTISDAAFVYGRVWILPFW